ncbi:acyltransferase family protein [Jejuia pallidilutea]|uniref:Acyltransferase n=1 Tax=Jejuia pallidilutea TaxID=504487 RepID=A0A090WV86_9FLAO|nr:acyltransferase family protein [Jejuia pallidilutea]GAL67507.1 acyltransferase [Jejuia pallidilutea]GAL71307.1 acyltransferase [Jejuia pallidilutea]GAL88719.1 acyltransferase [Jejuia pallidilutea]
MEKERILYIDRLRGINILLVVMGHVITGNVINGERAEILIYGSTFRMPLFMFLCGYVASKVIKPKIFDNYGAFVLKKTRTILLPFFAWPLLVDPFFFSDTLEFNFFETFKDLINGGGFWFLYYLFFITMLYSLWLFLSYRFNANKNIVYDLVFLLIIGLALIVIWQLDVISFMRNFMLFYVFYFLGVIVAKYDFLSKLLMSKIGVSISLLAFILLVGHYQYGISSFKNTIIKLSCAISAIVVFYNVIRQLTFNSFIDKYIRLWGVHSLVLYVTNTYVAYLYPSSFISEELNQIPLFVVTGLLTVFVAVVCMLIYKVFSYSNILGLLLYGNKISLKNN